MTDQSTLKALRNKLSNLEDELETANDAQAALEKELGELKTELEAKEEKLQTALAEAKDASERCASSETKLQQLQEEKANAASEANHEKATSVPCADSGSSEEVERLRGEVQELHRSLKTSETEKQKLEAELTGSRKQLDEAAQEAQKIQKELKEALEQERQKVEGLEADVKQLQRSQQQASQNDAQKLKTVEAEYRVECQRLQQLCQELESDRDTALERMQRAEEALKEQHQQFQEYSKKSAAEARSNADSMGKEVEARNARIAQLQAEAQRQSQAFTEEQRKAQDLQEQLTAYVGTHQELFTRFQAAVEQLDSQKDLCKKVTVERDELRRAHEEISEELKQERERAEKERQEAEQVRQELAKAKPPQLSDVLISVSFKEVDRPLEVKPWDTNFEEVVGAWLTTVQRSPHLQPSLVRYLKHLEETSTAYPLHQDAKLFEVHEQFADGAF